MNSNCHTFYVILLHVLHISRFLIKADLPMTVAIMIVYFSYLFALAWNPYSHRNHMIFMFSLPRKYYSEKYWKLSCSFCFCSNDNTFCLSIHVLYP